MVHCIRSKTQVVPNSNFLNANDSYSPSFTWHSLLCTKELLAAGLQWSIGNGESVPIVGIPWLPKPNTFQVIHPPKSLNGSETVSALMTDNVWNKKLIREMFECDDSECVLSISLPSDQRQDVLIWHYGKQGQFSVRSAYSLACVLASNGNSSNIMRTWGSVWELHIAPKIRLFIWKMCNKQCISSLFWAPVK
ncbi:UNVERIFIED_CONTAM: hypothetical protein Sradi_5748900 [Sesamum radiatum]|uniref:Reverse transcriptase zinc-binding domain-containing protein n=1 Tax=Sesamum radiatum TaxID=300843 RepID=A0AAW2L6M8_SESRA